MTTKAIYPTLKKSFNKTIKWNNHMYKLITVKPNETEALKAENKIPRNYFAKIVEHTKNGISAYGIYKSEKKRFG